MYGAENEDAYIRGMKCARRLLLLVLGYILTVRSVSIVIWVYIIYISEL